VRDKLANFGILTDEKGCHISIGDPFVHLLRQHAVSFEFKIKTGGTFILPPKVKPKGKSKLKKWTCGCQNVRVGKAVFKATCDICDNKFELAL